MRTISRAGIALLLIVAAITLLSGGPGLVGGDTGRVGAAAPEIGGGPWVGSAPLTMAGLRGRVVLLEFWTYG